MRDRVEKGGKRVYSVADLERYVVEAGFEDFRPHAYGSVLYSMPARGRRNISPSSQAGSPARMARHDMGTIRGTIASKDETEMSQVELRSFPPCYSAVHRRRVAKVE
jgi:hypothetical protein